jgi:Staphylococcal nuclease homologue
VRTEADEQRFLENLHRFLGLVKEEGVMCTTLSEASRLRISPPKRVQILCLCLARRAKYAATELVFDNEVTLQTHGHDKYQRTIGNVILLDGMSLNHELVKEGWCWWYRKYAPGDTELEKLETEAREARKGLWGDPQPVPPWEWRKRNK